MNNQLTNTQAAIIKAASEDQFFSNMPGSIPGALVMGAIPGAAVGGASALLSGEKDPTKKRRLAIKRALIGAATTGGAYGAYRAGQQSGYSGGLDDGAEYTSSIFLPQS